MTRTARSTHPRAMLKDRSESRNGLDKTVKKGGAGAHSWGDVMEELEDNWDDVGEESQDNLKPETQPEITATDQKERLQPDTDNAPSDPVALPQRRSTRRRAASVSVSYTEEELETAKQFRTHVFGSGVVDLASIARTSAAVANPANRTPGARKSSKSFSSTNSFASE
ncbi:hypothetical protein M408DRAFT_331057 [Serendipita vermifera MAFF 305830]|uniref:Hyaluronan/mRNA-binding protein domain-containing protein n=1 Tax=Serendipita vermifera MAFF 305830 TaxID=933852 RepID=A0A0C2X922_SERVB|nr:hypothetical protein M408DRAFT_331057 [Serendipita vermifera MAFF 305830]